MLACDIADDIANPARTATPRPFDTLMRSPLIGWVWGLVSLFLEDRVNRPLPAALVRVAQHVGGRLARGDDLAQRIEEQALVAALAVAAVAAMEAGGGNLECRLREIEHRAAAEPGVQARFRHVVAQRLALLARPVLDQIERGVGRGVVVEQPDPKRGQGAQSAPRSAVGAAHLKEFFEAYFGKGGGEMVAPIAHRRQFAGQAGQFAGEEIAERLAGDVDIFAVA